MPKELIARVTMDDLTMETFCGSGPGGQHRNKNQTAVRLTHPESGLSAESSTYKSQLQNKRAAFRKLATKLGDYFRRKFLAEQGEVVRPDARYGGQARRTYHAVDNRVTDHASGKQRPYQRTLDGDLDPLR